MLNYYQILGISADATQDEIKAAFKKKAIQYHPDKHAGDIAMEELFKEVNNAYQTLSNPYTKSRYDLSLNYGSFQTQYNPPPQPQPYSYRRAPFRPAYTKRFDSKENLRATLYAFLFAFVIGLIVKSGMWTLEYVRAEEKAELLAERRAVFDSARHAYDTGNIRASLDILDSFKSFDRSEKDIRDFKDNIIISIMTNASNHLQKQNYQRAIEMFDILESFPISSSLNFKLKKAEAYKAVGDYQNTIEIYEKLYNAGYRTTSFHYEIGLTYENGAGNFDQALKFYEVAAKYATAEYESNMGKAYPIIISAANIPKSHYDIYIKLANAYYETEDFEKGIESLRWTKDIWPDSAMNYFISAKCHLALNQNRLACADFNMAKFKNSNLDIPNLCR